jgi:type II secretory pathway component PulM
LKDNKNWLIAAFVGGTLVSVLAYSVVFQPTNENFNNTQSMFADCVPVNGRCP